MEQFALGNKAGFKWFCFITDNATRLGKMDFKPCAFGHCVFPWPSQADYGVHDVLLGACAALVAGFSGMMDKQNCDAPAPQIQKPCLHGLPGLSLIFLTCAAKSGDIVQHQHVHAFQKGFKHGLAAVRG